LCPPEVAAVTIKEQLLRLVRIQELVLSIRQARDLVDSAPRMIEEIEQRFRERNAEYVAVKERHQALEEDQRRRSGEMGLLEEHRKKYKQDLMQVQNQREYAAMLKEIDVVESQIAGHEDAILRDLEELESVKTDLASHEAHIQEERQQVAVERDGVEQRADEARRVIERDDAQRQRLEAELPDPLVDSLHRLEESRQGLFLSRADEGICQSCFVRVRPQVFQEIKLAVQIHGCSHCRRLLYHEPSLRTAEPGEVQRQAAGNAGAVEARDGGAV
jgi:predicted  nucleic acid-binding Zn-ribbon protein